MDARDDSISALFHSLYKNNRNPEIYGRIVQELVELSNTRANDFLNNKALFVYLQKMIRSGSTEAVWHILDQISKDPSRKSLLKEKFIAFSTEMSKQDVSVLLDMLKKLEVRHIFDMSAIMASEKPHVYSLLGHGCTFITKPPIRVPRGVIWIEMSVCGESTFIGDINKFIKPQIRDFLETTPMPHDTASRNAYNSFLDKHLDGIVSAKFEGDMVASGRNTLFANDKKSDDLEKFWKSGIHRLYETMVPADYTTSKHNLRLLAPNVRSASHAQRLEDFIRVLYADSIYPTLEQVRKDTAIGETYNVSDLHKKVKLYEIEFEDLFWGIDVQAYEVTKPLIIIQAGCRNPCDGVLEPPVRRANSEDRQTEILGRLTKEQILEKKPDGRTRLMVLVESKLYDQAKLLVERMEREMSPREFIGFVLQEDATRKTVLATIPKGGEHMNAYFESKIDDARQRIFQEEEDELNMISRTSNIRSLFEALPRNHERREAYMKILEKILRLSGSKQDDFIKYDGLFPSLLFIQTNRYGFFIGEFETLLGNIASSEERKAALKAKFSEFRSGTDKDTTRLQRMLIDVGVLDRFEGGGTRKKKQFRKNRSTRRNKHFLK
jgi:hypothetical protein